MTLTIITKENIKQFNRYAYEGRSIPVNKIIYRGMDLPCLCNVRK